MFTVAWLSRRCIWGGAFNTENFRAGFEAVPFRFREAALALGFSRFGDLLQRDAADRRPDRAALVDQHVHQRAQEHLAPLRDRYPELTTTALQIKALTLQTIETFTVLAVIYLTLVWTLSAAIRAARGAPRPAGGAMIDVPDWVEPVARYMFEVGLPGHAPDRAISLVGSIR